MGCISGLVRTIMFIFNIACLIVGLVLLVLGSLVYAGVSDYKDSMPGPVTAVPILLIVIGVFIFLVSFLGCCGAIKSNKCMLLTYAIVLIIMLVVQLGAGIYGLVQVNSRYTEFKGEIISGLSKTFQNYGKDEASTILFDSLQSVYNCCGVNSAADYVPLLISPPGSCCGKQPKEQCSVADLLVKKGCGGKFFDVIETSIRTISIVAIVICAVELVGALFAIYLSRKK